MGVTAVGHTATGVNSITVGFDEALNAGSAEDPSLYHVFEAARQKGKTDSTKSVPIGHVSYDDEAHTVTITLAHPLQGTVQVTVHGKVLSLDGGTSPVDFKAVVQ
jgi:hypothetical protein